MLRVRSRSRASFLALGRSGALRFGMAIAMAIGSGFGFGLGYGCGEPGRDDWPAGRPKIDELIFAQQSPHDSLAFEFVLVFSDTDGNLGQGALVLAINDKDSATLALSDLFPIQTPPIDLRATEGELDVVARLGRSPALNEEVKFGFRLRDEDGRESNEPSIVFKATSGSDAR
ncbi:MAG: hypothetical protein IPK13_16640 [Deltaproteobacteria bacterium]|nr:hypothetical protein [Deltaproteobacteria bacterium]